MEKDELPIIDSYSLPLMHYNKIHYQNTYLFYYSIILFIYIYSLISESIKFYIISEFTNIILSDVFSILFTITIKFNLKLYNCIYIYIYIYVHIIYVWIIISKCKHIFSVDYWNENLKNCWIFKKLKRIL